MKAAVLHEFGTPQFGDFSDPVATDENEVVTVLAAGINHIDVRIAAGAVPFAKPELPGVPGTDGVGRTADGTVVYFERSVAPFGSLGEQTLIRRGSGFPVPEGTDPAIATVLGNYGGLTAYVPLIHHAALSPQDAVVVLGATGTVGRIAIQLARRAGARRVVGVARDAARLEELHELGADAVVSTQEEDLPRALREATDGGADVIVDLLWGAPAIAALRAARPGARLMQIGILAGGQVEFPSSVLRAAGVTIRGVNDKLDSPELRRSAYRELCELVIAGELRVDVDRFPLERIEDAWRLQESGPRRKLVVEPAAADGAAD